MTKKERAHIEKKIKEYNEAYHDLDRRYECATDEYEKHRYMMDAQKFFDKSYALEMLLLELDNL